MRITGFSKIVRRIHMYLALFLIPWMLMYALSTFMMYHNKFFKEAYGGNVVGWQKESERTYPAQFGADTHPKLMAQQILRDLRMEGGHTVNRDRGGITIVRTNALTPTRITYRPADGKMVIEKQEFRAQPFLSRLHMRRGFDSNYAADDAWAVSVDLAIVGIGFWVLSGLWMCWELRVTRKFGALCALAGFVLFTVFVFTV